MIAHHTHSSRETENLGVAIAKRVVSSRPKKTAQVFALTGDLGAGKTTFVKGFFRGLGLRTRVTSPTFIIMRHHRMPRGSGHKLKVKSYKFEDVHHVDAYRLKTFTGELRAEFIRILKDPQNIALIEWAEHIKKFLPKSTSWIRFEHGVSENLRTIRVQSRI